VAAAATFFEHQQVARRNTRVMVLLFVFAVLGVILAVDAVLAGVWIFGIADSGVVEPGRRAGVLTMIRSVPPQLYLWGAVITAALILIVSTVNVIKLADGGEAVARMAGARRVSPETRDPLERRFVNIVEEMAIASGVRVPAAYIMDGENGINAFAAGWDVSGAVVAVTRGTLQTLTRDELQGVIGHEFSHILNGDMRLNIRMIGVLAGVLFIGAIGGFIMRSIAESRGKKDGASAGIFAAGLALFIVGYVGLFFARVIKAAVSRQREFLADASAVQFTRNPDGIAGALDRIRASTALISNRRAEDMSHMFFGQGIKVWLGGLFDTHPPLEERISRVHPGFQPSAYREKRQAAAPQPAGGDFSFGRTAGFAGSAETASSEGRRVADIGSDWGRSAGESARLVGTVNPGKVDYAAMLLASLPALLREELRNVEGARAALIALLLAPKEDVMQQQLDAVRAAGAQALAERAKTLAPLTRRLGPAFHLPVVDLALPAAKAATVEAKQELLKALEAAIQADRRVSLHEFVVLMLVREQLAPKGKPGAAGSMKIVQLRSQAMAALHLVAHAGSRTDTTGAREEELRTALQMGAKEMGLDETDIAVPAGFTLESAASALEALKALAPLQKAILIKGLFAAVTADGTIRVAEAELMRLVGAVLDCPLPPMLDEIDPAALAA